MMKPFLTAPTTALCLGLMALPALAQNNTRPTTPQPSAGCVDMAKAEPATPPARGKDGAAPGNDGSTGWSGGTGGSYIGTNPQGSSQNSGSWQPPTARGLDPLASRPC